MHHIIVRNGADPSGDLSEFERSFEEAESGEKVSNEIGIPLGNNPRLKRCSSTGFLEITVHFST